MLPQIVRWRGWHWINAAPVPL